MVSAIYLHLPTKYEICDEVTDKVGDIVNFPRIELLVCFGIHIKEPSQFLALIELEHFLLIEKYLFICRWIALKKFYLLILLIKCFIEYLSPSILYAITVVVIFVNHIPTRSYSKEPEASLAHPIC
jgi:hypothetical protein